MWPLVLVIAAGAALGLATARPSAAVLTAGAVVGFYVGLDAGWWGSGTGDNWQYAMAIVVVAAVVVVLAAVFLRRARRG